MPEKHPATPFREPPNNMLIPTDNRRFTLPNENRPGELIATVLCLLAFAAIAYFATLFACFFGPLFVESVPVILKGMANVLKNP